MNADVILTANGPGEISGWLAPVAAELRRRKCELPAGARLFVWAPPCNFASGREVESIHRMGPWDGVFTPADMWVFLLRRGLPAGFRPAGRGVVMFLGGDLFYAAVLARRLGYTGLAYTEGRARWLRAYERFLVPDEGAERRALAMGAPRRQVERIGDLVVDAVGDRRRRAQAMPPPARVATGRKGVTVGLFAGSRDYEVRWVLPLFARAARRVRQALGGREIRFVAVRSPFASERVVQEALEEVGPAARQEIEWVTDEDWDGVRRTAAMMECDLAVTVPGTVTAELGALGIPMVTVLPLTRPELIPLEGVAGVAGSLPVVGRLLKAAVIARALGRGRLLAIPSRRAGRLLAPELVGRVEPERIAAEVVRLVDSPEELSSMGHAVRQAMGPGGAARRVVDRIVQCLAGGSEEGR